MHDHQAGVNMTSNNEGVQIDSVTSARGLEQLIYEPTHILSISSSCIDLIFINQPNLVVDSGTQSSLLPKFSSSNSSL